MSLFALRETSYQMIKSFLKTECEMDTYFIDEEVSSDDTYVVMNERPAQRIGNCNSDNGIYIELRVYSCNEYDASRLAYMVSDKLKIYDFNKIKIIESIVVDYPIHIEDGEWVRQIHLEIRKK